MYYYNDLSFTHYLIKEIETFRTNLALLCNFDWVPVPISYPQPEPSVTVVMLSEKYPPSLIDSALIQKKRYPE
ncbi:hypothetical protein TELCIR_04484 [Teladorsagia circumcincta]|uniref:Bestrophin homolog n=1 Tax=Teladorsagia circumcincta TaxID=45464 RepID=A0A2G9UTR6_TELCI|nr:hypothetical protein TELCIR_04484 [Teladorsagia circumcincta]